MPRPLGPAPAVVGLALAACSGTADPSPRPAGQPADATTTTTDGGPNPPAPNPDAGSVGSDAAALPRGPNGRGAFLWRGFEHEWLRTLAGFKIPHRVSKLHSFIDGEALTGADSAAPTAGAATFHFGQDTGVDGNFMVPKGRYAAVFGRDLYADRGHVDLSWTDDGDGSAYPKARSDLRRTVSIDISATALGGGALDGYAVVLGGVRLDVKCDGAKQPAGEPCNSNGMWPYKMRFELGACQRAPMKLECPLEVLIYRAWTPNLGGLPPLETKPFNDKLDFSLRVSYVVLGGSAAALRVTPGALVASSGMARDDAPKLTTETVTGAGGGRYPRAVTALTAFGFELSKSEAGDKFNHLGRYLGSLRFGLRDAGYDAASGAARIEHTAQAWVPITVEQSAVSYVTRATVLQLGDPGSSVSNREVTGTLCANSDGAPFFSVWRQCGDADKGPERDEHAVPIRIP